MALLFSQLRTQKTPLRSLWFHALLFYFMNVLTVQLFSLLSLAPARRTVKRNKRGQSLPCNCKSVLARTHSWAVHCGHTRIPADAYTNLLCCGELQYLLDWQAMPPYNGSIGFGSAECAAQARALVLLLRNGATIGRQRDKKWTCIKSSATRSTQEASSK